jgi:hypothetical protein
MSEDQKPDQGQERFRKFMKSFNDISESSANMVAISKKQIEVMNKMIDVTGLLFESITKDHDGMIAAVDDLITEIQGLREDLRAFAKVSGVQVSLGNILGGRGRRA